MEDLTEMEEESFTNTIIEECPIVFEMASLDLIDDSPKQIAVRRSLRRRSGIFENTLELDKNEKSSTESPKRRVIKQPKKRCSKLSDDQLSGIKDYYLCKKFKRLPSTFETIYEEPRLQKNQVVFVANKKEKRILSFGNSSTGKVKKRRLKIKKLLPNQSFTKRERLSMDYFLDKIGSCDLTASTDSSPQ